MIKIKHAQDLIKASTTSVACGFNMFISGEPPITYGDGWKDTHERMQGYEYAKKMAENDGIAFTHRFKCVCGDIPISYGGSFCCNGCGRANVKKPWWEIVVEKDGNDFCCHGLDFVNLQESSNYAFGKTFNEAIENYGKLFINKL